MPKPVAVEPVVTAEGPKIIEKIVEKTKYVHDCPDKSEHRAYAQLKRLKAQLNNLPTNLNADELAAIKSKIQSEIAEILV